jgi:hypothetical protein
MVMAKRKAHYVKTNEGIYNMEKYSAFFKIEDGHFVRLDDEHIKFEIIAEEHDLFNFIRFNEDIVEVKELGRTTRYTKIAELYDQDALLDTDGIVVDVGYITAILDYDDYRDIYVRYQIL